MNSSPRSFVTGRIVRWFAFAMVWCSGFGMEAAALAQGGYRMETVGRLGLTLPVPRDYEAIPVQPTEPWTALQWRANPARGEKDVDPAALPRFELVWIPRISDVAITGESDEPPPPGDDDGQGDDEEEEPEIGYEELHPINSIEDYMDRVLGSFWVLAEPEEDKCKAEDFRMTIYSMVPGERNETKYWKGWACGLRGPDVEMLFIGFCSEDHWPDHTKIWRNMARKAEIEAPAAKDLVKLSTNQSRI